ncbi:hypothetical protein P7C71_g1805, partial [Lecanoromycetidae sp. Uapishka_2]
MCKYMRLISSKKPEVPDPRRNPLDGKRYRDLFASPPAVHTLVADAKADAFNAKAISLTWSREEEFEHFGNIMQAEHDAEAIFAEWERERELEGMLMQHLLTLPESQRAGYTSTHDQQEVEGKINRTKELAMAMRKNEIIAKAETAMLMYLAAIERQQADEARAAEAAEAARQEEAAAQEAQAAEKCAEKKRINREFCVDMATCVREYAAAQRAEKERKRQEAEAAETARQRESAAQEAQAAEQRAENERKLLAFQPVIREIVRTKVCFEDIKLLVDKIHIVDLPVRDNVTAKEAYRLFLTDRDTTIQGLLRRRLHKIINRLDIREGSYVVLKDYKLATAKRLNGEGDVVYLAISDLYSIGEERLEDEDVESVEHSPLTHGHDQKRKRASDSCDEELRDEAPARKTAKTGGQSMQHNAPPSDPAHSLNWHETARMEHHRRCHTLDKEETVINCRSFTPYAEKAMKAGKPLQPISRPLRLSTLASVTGSNASRNKTIDVLAVIDSVDDHTTKRKDIPLYRDIHIADPSTQKIVTLSVFIDPIGFLPAAGDIALFRSVTTHEYKGGKLNAYPQHCEGKDWYVPDPHCIKGCEDTLSALIDFKKNHRG